MARLAGAVWGLTGFLAGRDVVKDWFELKISYYGGLMILALIGPLVKIFLEVFISPILSPFYL